MPARRLRSGVRRSCSSPLCTSDYERDDNVGVSTLADAFEEQPHQWGLRGDPHVWAAMRELLAEAPVPEGEDAVRAAYVAAFAAVTRLDLDTETEDMVFRKELDHGGMSGDMVDLRWWRATGIPFLVRRAAEMSDRP